MKNEKKEEKESNVNNIENQKGNNVKVNSLNQNINSKDLMDINKVKAIMELLQTKNPNLNNFSTLPMDKDKLIESFVLFQGIINMNQILSQQQKNENNQNEKEEIAQNQIEFNIEKQSELNEQKEEIIIENEEEQNKEEVHVTEENDERFLKTEETPADDNKEEIFEIEGKEEDEKEKEKEIKQNEEIPHLEDVLKSKKHIQLSQNKFDDMPIKSSNVNFLELLEQNLEKQNQIYPEKNEPVKKFTPTRVLKKQIEISKPNKNEIKKYKYYTDNFDEAEKKTEAEKEKKKIAREKAKEIGQRFNPNKTQPEKEKVQDKDKEKPPSKPNLNYNNKTIQKENQQLKSQRKSNDNQGYSTEQIWKEAKFDNSQDDQVNENLYSSEKKFPTAIEKLEFGGTKKQGNTKRNYVIGIQQSENFVKSEKQIGLNKPDTKQNNEKPIQQKRPVYSHSSKGKSIRQNISPSKKSNSSTKIPFIKTKNQGNTIANNEIMNLNQEDQFEDISNLIIAPNNSERILQDKIEEYNQEFQRLRNENLRVMKLREDYEKLNNKLQKDIKEFNMKKEQEMMKIEAFKDEEIKKLSKERKQFSLEQKQYNDYKNKGQASSNKKDKELIDQLTTQVKKLQEELKFKESTNKLLIIRYKKQLEEANNKIHELNEFISQMNLDIPLETKIAKTEMQNSSYKNGIIPQSQNIQIESHNQEQNSHLITNTQLNKKKITKNSNDEIDEEESYDMIFPDKYHKVEYHLMRIENSNDGKVIKFYNKDKKEIIFKSGVRKEIFNDGYQMVYFNNGDLKQIYPDGKVVYFFNETRTVQITYPDKLQTYKFENGQIEKHYPDGTKQIAFPDGSLRYIFPDGTEETYYLDGKVQKIDKSGVIVLEHENGYQEIKYPDGRQVVEYGKK